MSQEMISHSLFRAWRGHPYPLGATLKKDGTNFAIFSENAEAVELCLFSVDGQEIARIPMTEQSNSVWHAFIPGVRAGQLYGYRVHGPYDPGRGLRFNSNKVLIDPYAKAICGPVKWDDAVYAYTIGNENSDLAFDSRDSAPFIPKGVVVDSAFDWEDESLPQVPWHETVIYETHVKGFTARHPAVPPELRGTYSGLCHPAVIDHFKRLGVTSIELLPVHHFVDDRFLLEKGLRNYWGYNSIGYFAPDFRYSSAGHHGQQVREFKEMVKTLHQAGLEVIIDVVYNHTAEGNHLGPTLSFRGMDNPSYYRLVPNEERYYRDYTGCGNTLNVLNPRTLQLIMDSLRYWVQEMHVDGFRFDLAASLARGFHEVNRLHSFFDIILQDPSLSQVKLIAEPWDIGEGGYQVGNFPEHWAEWNDKYRDTVRAYWKGEGGIIGDFANRLTGSSDLYESSGRRPFASINFVTAHDGFSLTDLVSYNEKHNEANKENNQDGNSHNLSWNCGTEGPTKDPAILELRRRQKRNLLATLLLSQGVPMLLAGDEIGRTQAGNNNAYCQDNEISWLNWESVDSSLLSFTRDLLDLRRSHPVFHRRHFFQGEPLRGEGVKDIMWLMATGREMNDEEWNKDSARCLGVFLTGEHLRDKDRFGRPVQDDNFVLLFNAHHERVSFQLPEFTRPHWWRIVFDTSEEPSFPKTERLFMPTDPYPLQGRSTVLLVQTPERPPEERNQPD